MSKNTKANKKSNWFNERKYGKSIITAIRNPTKDTGKKNEVKTGDKVRNIDAVRQVLTEAKGRISIEDAVKRFIEIHPMRSSKPEIAAKTAFIQATAHGCPVTISKEEDKTFIELA